MSRKKNKIELLDDILSLKNTIELDDWYYDIYWYDDYPLGHSYDCDYESYDYLKDIKLERVSKLGGRITIGAYSIGSYINMDSIYSKEILREKKINYLLGLDQSSTILGDFFPKNLR